MKSALKCFIVQMLRRDRACTVCPGPALDLEKILLQCHLIIFKGYEAFRRGHDDKYNIYCSLFAHYKYNCKNHNARSE